MNNTTDATTHTLAFAGDLVLDVPEPDYWLSGIAPLLARVDLAIGHLEVPHTRRGEEMRGDIPAPAADPEALHAIQRAGFDALTMAGNHIADQGSAGIEDTLAELAQVGVAACGAAGNIGEARRAALLSLGPHTVALLSYNCVGPESSWATKVRAGCAYLPMTTSDGGPVTPLSSLTMSAAAREILAADIALVRSEADLVVVALHKGIVHTPAKLADYERPVAHAAVDGGADIVIGHHAHIVRGIEVYRGKPIFHGLGNGCVVTNALAPDQSHADRAKWAERRKELFDFEPDPDFTLAPFHPEAINAMLGYVSRTVDGSLEAGILPVHVEAPGRPVVADDSRAREIAQYVEQITLAAGLPAIKLERASDAWRLA